MKTAAQNVKRVKLCNCNVFIGNLLGGKKGGWVGLADCWIMVLTECGEKWLWPNLIQQP
jgi:hypothetical protein